MSTNFRRTRRIMNLGLRHFWRQLNMAFRNPLFLILTVLGNIVLFSCSLLFYLFESGKNPNLSSFWDALWWGFITMTTVGYGDIFPVTWAGRIVSVFLLLTGGVLFLSFIALLSSVFVEREFHELESEVHELGRSLKTFKKEHPDNPRI